MWRMLVIEMITCFSREFIIFDILLLLLNMGWLLAELALDLIYCIVNEMQIKWMNK